MKLFFPLFLCFSLLLFSCIDSKDEIYYDGAEANSKIFSAYALKDASCGSNHRITTILFGRVKVTDVNRCISAVNLMDCVAWNVEDPSPLSCKSINYIFK
ncbi:LIC13255 family lipoprotein [Leptospira idonii]|uniref:Lipoprotein n=1 Tax=Leptospira idonii TaxID=1193500 RepID=A0A4R9M149_9LEPT|nr:hypothetical protein [Leptospira idonii]TGN20464.1 hypothetical protein EHS15_04455 [Leptospira idonii]